jgi:hypothetical protein
MQIIQLNPSIPLDTPKGQGLAILVTWLNEEHNLLWTVIQDETGEIWTWENPKVRGTKNIQMNRIISNDYLKGDITSNCGNPFRRERD